MSWSWGIPAACSAESRAVKNRPARGGGQRGVHSGIGESADVVEVCGAAGEREPLGGGPEGIHRDRNAADQELVQDRGEPLLFFGGGDGFGARVAGRRAEFDDVGAFGVQLPGVPDRVGGGEVAAAVGEGVFGDVDDPDDTWPSCRGERRGRHSWMPG
jgi:hypothetical protein